MMDFNALEGFYRGKKVFVTGHTGFKGAWLCKILVMMGAEVYGYSLEPPTSPCVFDLLDIEESINSTIGDVRDYDSLKICFDKAKPEIVFHLAAQPIVRESYRIPRETYEINVMGTVNILECIRKSKTVKSFLNVTTDKVYDNQDAENHAFREEEKLDGYDPYSNSKSCSELVTHSYKKSFFNDESQIAISTARAGNVIGGGDFSKDRIIPDCVRAAISGKKINVRNPFSVRPYQHVLEPLGLYLTIAMKQYEERQLSGYYNVGPDEEDCVTTGGLADLFVNNWGENISWENVSDENAPHEANYLRLDCTEVKKTFGWEPVWHINETVKRTVEWYKAWSLDEDLNKLTEVQIRDFFG